MNTGEREFDARRFRQNNTSGTRRRLRGHVPLFITVRLHRDSVLLLEMVDNSINLCKLISGWYFRQKAVRTGHLTLG